MKRKLTIVFTVATLILSLSLFAFSVYAALNQSFSINNTISFISTNVAVNVKGTITGALQTDIDESNLPEGFVSVEEYLLSKNFIYFGSADGEANLPLWEIDEPLKFKNDINSFITYTLEIENLSDFAIKVYLIDFIESNVNIENNASSTITNFITIDGMAAGQTEGQKKTITLTTKAKQRENGFTENNNFGVIIKNIND